MADETLLQQQPSVPQVSLDIFKTPASYWFIGFLYILYWPDASLYMLVDVFTSRGTCLNKLSSIPRVFTSTIPYKFHEWCVVMATYHIPGIPVCLLTECQACKYANK